MAQAQITRFAGPYRFLSNFFDVSPSKIEYNGRLYATVEHGYQAAKAVSGIDRDRIERAPTPAAAKRLGRQVRLRPDWEDCKIEVMRDLVRAKFRIVRLQKMLLDTGDAHLEEGNTWGDREWGTVNGVGSNLLGKILMEVRTELLDGR